MENGNTALSNSKSLLASARGEVGRLLADKERLMQELERFRRLTCLSTSVELAIARDGGARRSALCVRV